VALDPAKRLALFAMRRDDGAKCQRAVPFNQAELPIVPRVFRGGEEPLIIDLCGKFGLPTSKITTG
jgi:hypothetical protein